LSRSCSPDATSQALTSPETNSLHPRFRGGRLRRISTDDEARIVALAGARPQALGAPYTRWSLAKLSRYLAGQGITVSPSHLGRILGRNGISFQAGETRPCASRGPAGRAGLA